MYAFRLYSRLQRGWIEWTRFPWDCWRRKKKRSRLSMPYFPAELPFFICGFSFLHVRWAARQGSFAVLLCYKAWTTFAFFFIFSFFIYFSFCLLLWKSSRLAVTHQVAARLLPFLFEANNHSRLFTSDSTRLGEKSGNQSAPRSLLSARLPGTITFNVDLHQHCQHLIYINTKAAIIVYAITVV